MGTVSGYILGIESAIGGGSLSLQHDGVEIAGCSGDGTLARAEALLPAIDLLLQENRLSIRDLGAIIVSTGPGSYTGIRVGVATVLGLRSTVSVRCLGVTALQAMASVANGVTVTLTAVPMGRNMVCSQLFHSDRSSVPKLSTNEEFIASTAAFDGSCVLHRSLFDALEMLDSTRIIDAGNNLAALIAAAVNSEFATEDLSPLFVDRS